MPRAPKISAERVRQVLDYDPNTGVFRWKEKTAHSTVIGAEASPKPSSNGYKVISIDRGDYLAQRLAWAIVMGEFSEHPITFKDGDKLNLKWENLAEKKPMHKSKFDHSTPEGRAEYGRAWRNNPENAAKYKDNALKSDFGLTLDQYNQMLVAQNGCCDICKKPEMATRNGKVKALCVDHDHENGQIRSLLCTKCNVALGAVNDSQEILTKMIAYLGGHKKKQSQSNVIHLKGAKK